VDISMSRLYNGGPIGDFPVSVNAPGPEGQIGT
jgi:hypothetical protein